MSRRCSTPVLLVWLTHSKKYDPRHETNFSTYAQFRIRGTILDSFRVQDWVPRSLRHKAHKLENTYLKLEQELGRPAEDTEVAEALGIDIKALHKMLGEVTGVVMLSLEELGFGHGEERFRADESLPSSRPDPLSQLLDGEKVEIVARALDRLPEKERLVVTLYFYEELNPEKRSAKLLELQSLALLKFALAHYFA